MGKTKLKSKTKIFTPQSVAVMAGLAVVGVVLVVATFASSHWQAHLVPEGRPSTFIGHGRVAGIADNPLGEDVTFGLKNVTGSLQYLNNSAPWRIINRDTGQAVYTPYAAQILTPVPPGASKTWSWNQRINGGAYAPAGRYKVSFYYTTAPRLGSPSTTKEFASVDFELVTVSIP